MTYEYLCTACGHQWEAEQSITAAPLKQCPSCAEQTAKRQVSGGAGFILRGGGWYADGYGSQKPGSTSSEGEGKAEDKAEGKDTKAGGDKKAAGDAQGDKAAAKGDAPTDSSGQSTSGSTETKNKTKNKNKSAA